MWFTKDTKDCRPCMCVSDDKGATWSTPRRLIDCPGYGFLNLCACLIGGQSIYAGGALRDSGIPLNRLFQLSVISLVFCALLLLLIKTNPPPPAWK